MKIKTWIKYEESFIPPRCRKPRFTEREDHVDVTLREETMDNLQLAFEDNSFNGKGKIFYYPKGRTLWRKAKMIDVCAPGGEKEYGYHTPLEALILWNDHSSQYFRLSYDRTVGRDTSLAGTLKDVRRDMRKYMLVDGELFVKTSVPFYNITTFGLGNNHGSTGLFVCYNKRMDSKWFNALQGEAAVSAAKAIAEGRGDTDSIPRIREMIVVHMPELVR